jgi:hypothetical protein
MVGIGSSCQLRSEHLPGARHSIITVADSFRVTVQLIPITAPVMRRVSDALWITIFKTDFAIRTKLRILFDALVERSSSIPV